jgi:hypothetical protein
MSFKRTPIEDVTRLPDGSIDYPTEIRKRSENANKAGSNTDKSSSGFDKSSTSEGTKTNWSRISSEEGSTLGFGNQELNPTGKGGPSLFSILSIVILIIIVIALFKETTIKETPNENKNNESNSDEVIEKTIKDMWKSKQALAIKRAITFLAIIAFIGLAYVVINFTLKQMRKVEETVSS